MSGERKSPFEGRRFDCSNADGEHGIPPFGCLGCHRMIRTSEGQYVTFEDAEGVLCQRDELAEVIRKYRSEHENPVPDYGLRRKYRDEMFAALDKLEAEP